MIRPALHLLLYSEALQAGGGRETWLSYFLPLLAARGRFRAITVYHMRPRPGHDTVSDLIGSSPEGSRGAEPHRPTPWRFVDSGLELHGSEGSSVGGAARRFLAFTRTVLSGLHRDARAGDLLLAVGVHGEAPPALLGWLSSVVARRRLKLAVWIREASLRLVQERRGAAVHGALDLLRRSVLSVAGRIVLNGEDTLAIYARQHPRLRDRMVLIPNAADMQRFAGPLPELGVGPLRVGFVGRFLKIKGFQDMLAAARLLAEDPPAGGIELVAWGLPDPCEPLGEPPPNTTLHPEGLSATEVPAALASVHALLILNHTRNLEAGGLSHALLEALAAGRTVVAWDNHCHRQVLDEQNAILVPEGDVTALAQALRDLAGDGSVLTALAQAGRRTAEGYSCERHVDRFLAEVVDPLLGGP